MIFLIWSYLNIFAKTVHQFDYQFDQLSLEKKLEYCEKISPDEYVSGLMDGNFIIPSFFGKTYYYRSRCFYQIAESTLDEKYCDFAISRKSFLGDGSIISPEVCRKNVQSRIQLKLKSEKETLDYKEKTKNLIKLNSLNIKKEPNENWLLEITFSGNLFGEYEILVENLNANFKGNDKIIFRKTTIIKTTDHKEQISISKKQMESCLGCKDKLVNPIGIVLILNKANEQLNLNYPIYSNVLNGYLSN